MHPETSWSDFVRSLPVDLARLAIQVQPAPNRITGVVLDSRRVNPGNIFVALTGGNFDGHRFISHAAEQGAVLAVGEREESGLPIPYLQVKDSREALAYLSAAFYGLPARRLTMIGVTGTDGKTTTSNLIYQILLAAGLRAGMISTVNAVIGERVLDTGFHVTTPEAPDVQNYLAQMVEAGITHVVLETTSHGLAQQRVTACDFDLGVVTNITHEHLDYHQTLEAYRAAKARLLTSLASTPLKFMGNRRVAVLNRDDSSFDYLSSVIKPLQPGVRTVDYGLSPLASLRAEHILSTAGGIEFLARGEGLQITVHSNLVGKYNVSNCLAAIAATTIGLGIDPQAAQAGIANLSGIPGRMERIDSGQDFLAIVDFAHTPNALRVSLSAARSMAGSQGRVIAVFGSAGLRDRLKRRLMAQVANELADITVLTAEDPRTESLEDILADMAAGMTDMGGNIEIL